MLQFIRRRFFGCHRTATTVFENSGFLLGLYRYGCHLTWDGNWYKASFRCYGIVTSWFPVDHPNLMVNEVYFVGRSNIFCPLHRQLHFLQLVVSGVTIVGFRAQLRRSNGRAYWHLYRPANGGNLLVHAWDVNNVFGVNSIC